MRYLIAGKNGQLAKAFIEKLERAAADYNAPDEHAFDITDPKSVNSVVAAYKPNCIINCAAYNLVDKAEQEQDKVFAVNASGPQNLARAAAMHKSKFVHFGSDYVFDGKKETGLYTENDAVNPLNVYGKSKLAGEQLVAQENDSSLVFRLSWVYGSGKQNFMYKLAEWADKSDHLKITCDEFSVPTSSDMVADIALKAITQGVNGTYHLTNSGFCSRYEWAKFVLTFLGKTKFIRPVNMETFRLPAIRPGFSAMSNKAIADNLGVTIPTWEESVTAFLRKQEQNS